jgi:mono/diheme cytochrome c family protein
MLNVPGVHGKLSPSFGLSDPGQSVKSLTVKFNIIIVAWLSAAAVVSAGETNLPPATAAQIEHGKYLVECVGLCGDCHSPRNDKGEFDRSQWLQGELISFKPDHPMPFAAIAPPIAGLPGYATDAAALKFLETGTNAAGKLAMAPMPQFRLQHEDALAVVAYLRSLKK